MLSLEHFVDHRDQAAAYLAAALRDGSLNLFVGAGVSQPLGLPGWDALATRCADATGVVPTAGMSVELIMDAVERGRSFGDYAALVHTQLYKGVKFTSDIVRERLLIALGALTMPSRRGSVDTVITLNFDDVLEQYWEIHGFTSLVVTELPAQLRGVDVTIFHPNGYLPSDRTRATANFIVFSKRSFEARQTSAGDAWRRVLEDMFTTRVVLAVGVSGNDSILGTVLQEAKAAVGPFRPSAFWMRGPGEILDDAYFLDRNVVPLNFASFDDYPDFIFDICRRAAQKAIFTGST
jgi:hypothetical protein